MTGPTGTPNRTVLHPYSEQEAVALCVCGHHRLAHRADWCEACERSIRASIIEVERAALAPLGLTLTADGVVKRLDA